MEETETLLNENTRLVYFVLRRYFPSMTGDQDLAQEGFIGLWKACLSYDGREGVKFSTFAVACIKNTMLTELRKRRRVPAMASLDAPLGAQDETLCLGDILEDPAASAFEAETLSADFLSHLSAHDRELIELRMSGLNQQSVGNSIGVAQSIVSRRLKKIRRLYQRAGGD